MNLFALTNVPGARILRFPLTHDLQNDVQQLFEQQSDTFMNGIVTTVAFDGRYIPDEGEILAIDDFEDIDGMSDAVANPLTIEQFDPQVHSLDTVKALFSSRTNDGSVQILIQFFESRRLIATKGLAIFFSGNTFHKMSHAGLTLDTKLLAILEGTNLKFQSFHFLRRVFDLSDYYNEATNDEVTAFAQHQNLSVVNLADFIQTASPLIRKKIALIRQSGVLDQFTVPQIVATAQTFSVDIQISATGQILLPTNKTDLRRLLRFLDEDYYESPLSLTHYVSNSKRVAD